ncbi:MAG: sigma-70 family RNA polymerase sigma factor [Chloroflexota bacterium]|nr:sigma-70 family RNA polymerase sigma factor [Chloroflexota bacterium]
MTARDDGDLIQAIARQDSSALMMLYERYGRLSFALAYRIVGDPSLAEEVVQDAFLQVWNRATTFDHARGGNVRGWLMTIVHHRSIDFRRRDLDRKPTNVPLEDVENVLSVPDVWGAVSASLTRDSMRAAVDTLPRDQRRAIELAFFDGLTHNEIAEQENAPLGTIKGRLRLGMRKLRVVLTEANDPNGSLLSGPDDDVRQAESLSR